MPVEVSQEVPEPQHHGVVNVADVGTVQHRAARGGRCGDRGRRVRGQREATEGSGPSREGGGGVCRTCDHSRLETAAATPFRGGTGPFSSPNTNSREQRTVFRNKRWETAPPAVCRRQAPTGCPQDALRPPGPEWVSSLAAEDRDSGSRGSRRGYREGGRESGGPSPRTFQSPTQYRLPEGLDGWEVQTAGRLQDQHRPLRHLGTEQGTAGGSYRQVRSGSSERVAPPAGGPNPGRQNRAGGAQLTGPHAYPQPHVQRESSVVHGRRLTPVRCVNGHWVVPRARVAPKRRATVEPRGTAQGTRHPTRPPEASRPLARGEQTGRYLHLGSGHRVQEDQSGHQGPGQDAVLDLPEAEQERHAEGQQVQPWKRGVQLRGGPLRISWAPASPSPRETSVWGLRG